MGGSYFDSTGAKGWIHEVGVRYDREREVGYERMVNMFVM
jgi:hypothetical protein